MKVLGIETSCDETSAAIVDENKVIHAHIVCSQLKEHKAFGGVVPEIGARSHIDALDGIVKAVLIDAKMKIEDLDGIAVTAGPGLIGGVLVGAMYAKGLSLASGKPFVAVNHLEGHALSPRLDSDISFPYMLLLVSGGHCQIIKAEGVGNYRIIGTTIDDAVGECFDKVARMLGFGYPGGKYIEEYARRGNSKAYHLPKPLLDKESLNFSFSGLKTAVKRLIDSVELNDKVIADISATFQTIVTDVLVEKVKRAFEQNVGYTNNLVVAGGVAANMFIKNALGELTQKFGIHLYYPPHFLCTDNGAMIAWAGLERLKLGLTDSLDFEPRSRWSLEDLNRG